MVVISHSLVKIECKDTDVSKDRQFQRILRKVVVFHTLRRKFVEQNVVAIGGLKGKFAFCSLSDENS